MNKILKPAAASTLGACSYETPTINVVEVVSEGVLCGSGHFQEYGDGGDILW